MKTELFSEINGRFVLIEHGDPHFLLYKLNEDSVPKAKQKSSQKSMIRFCTV